MELQKMSVEDDEIAETSSSIVSKTDDSKEKSYDFEIVLEHIGKMGKYQALLTTFLIYSAFPVGMDEMSSVFLLGVPQHRCYIPELDDNSTYDNYSNQYILNISTPMTEEGYDGCNMYEYNYTKCIHEENLDCSSLQSNSSIVPCQKYIYSKEELGETAVSEWDLVCDRLILGTTSNSIYFFGGLVGSLFSGNISDNIGRRYVLLIGTILAVASGVACTYASSLIMFTAMKFILSLADSSTYTVGFVYVSELVGEEWRATVGVLYSLSFSVGYTLLSPMASYWRDWRNLQFAMSLFFAFCLLLRIFIPESPRWLFARGRNSEGKKISHMIAKRNGLVVSRDIWIKSLQKKDHKVKSQQYYSTVTLFRKREMRKVTFIMMFCWFTVSMVYLGLSLNVGALAGDLYVNNALSGIAEIAAGLATIVVIKRFGRRGPMIASFMLTGMLCISSSIANHYADGSYVLGLLGTSLALCGKVLITAAYDIIYVYISELYPTVVRATALSTANTCSLLSYVVTPYALYLQNYYSWLPGVLFGVLTILAGIASFPLKETRHQKMMTTIFEAELFYRA